MHILLDESVPWRLGHRLTGHTINSVQRRGWASLKSERLLALASAEFDVLLTADKGMEHHPNVDALPIAIIVVFGKSNRMEDLAPAVPAILKALAALQPRTLTKVAA